MHQKIKNIAEVLASLASIWVVLAAIAGGIWAFVDDEFSSKMAKITGAEQTAIHLQHISDELADTKHVLFQRMNSLEDRMNEIKTRNSIFEIDRIRSLVWEDCPTEGQCNYTMRLRRTEEGRNCQDPDVRRFVIDRFGVTHPVEGVDVERGASPDGSWTDLTNAFLLPDSIPSGVAEFYMERTYYGCFLDDPARKVREVTPKLIFTINPR